MNILLLISVLTILFIVVTSVLDKILSYIRKINKGIELKINNMKKVKIVNNSNKTIKVIVSPVIVRILSKEKSSEDSYTAKFANKNAVSFKGAEFSNEKSVELNYTNIESEKTTYENSENLKVGYCNISSKKYSEFDLNQNEFYLSIMIDDQVTMDNKFYDYSIGTIHIQEDGNSEDNKISIVENNSKIKLKIDSNKYIQDPERARSWPCANYGSSYGIHFIKSVDNSPIKHGSKVRIICENNTSAGDDCKDYKYMYSSNIGNVYYDKFSESDEQIWIVEKKGNDSISNEISNGDYVRFKNKNWTRACLGIDNKKWLDCLNDKEQYFQIILAK